MSDTRSDWWREHLSFGFLPVLDLEDPDVAAGAVATLAERGVPTIELSLKRPGAIDALASVARTEGVVIGAGTVLDASTARDAIATGAQFVVSPGWAPDVAVVCRDEGIPYLPGAVTPTEVGAVRRAGHHVVKWFPAEAGGGVAGLAQIAGVFTDVEFVPIGGVHEKHLAGYLAAPYVPAVGGTLLAPRVRCLAQDWRALRERVDWFLGVRDVATPDRPHRAQK